MFDVVGIIISIGFTYRVIGRPGIRIETITVGASPDRPQVFGLRATQMVEYV
jgi:hypothetical protein